MKKMLRSLLSVVVVLSMLMTLGSVTFAQTDSSNPVTSDVKIISVASGVESGREGGLYAEAYVDGEATDTILILASFDASGVLVETATTEGNNKLLQTDAWYAIKVPEGGSAKAFLWQKASRKVISNVAKWGITAEEVLDTLTLKVDGVDFKEYVGISDYSTTNASYTKTVSANAYGVISTPDVRGEIKSGSAYLNIETTKAKTIITITYGNIINNGSYTYSTTASSGICEPRSQIVYTLNHNYDLNGVEGENYAKDLIYDFAQATFNKSTQPSFKVAKFNKVVATEADKTIAAEEVTPSRTGGTTGQVFDIITDRQATASNPGLLTYIEPGLNLENAYVIKFPMDMYASTGFPEMYETANATYGKSCVSFKLGADARVYVLTKGEDSYAEKLAGMTPAAAYADEIAAEKAAWKSYAPLGNRYVLKATSGNIAFQRIAFRDYKKGETFNYRGIIKQSEYDTILVVPNNFGFVEKAEVSADVNSISIDGTPIAEFDDEVYTYNVEIPASQEVAPEIVVETVDEGAGVSITNPETLPGSAIVKVFGTNCPIKTFTINYTKPEVSADVESISVNGTPIAGFDNETYTYNVEIPASQASAPVIAVDTVDEGAGVKITNPETFPGSATVEVSGGSSKKTFTINYTCSTALVSDLTVLNDSAVTPTYKQNLQVGDRLFDTATASRIREVTSLGNGFEGADWIQFDKWIGELTTDAAYDSSKDFMSFRLNRSATVYIVGLTQNKYCTNAGFTKVSNTEVAQDAYVDVVNGSGTNVRCSTSYKSVSAGQTLTLKGFGNTTGYAVVIVYDGYTN